MSRLKAREATPRFRYQKVIKNHHRAPELIQNNIGISSDRYLQFEFNVGCKLLDFFWEDMDEAVVGYWKYALLTNPVHGYWSWFLNQKRQHDLKFLNEYQELLEIHVERLGPDRATARAQRDYTDEVFALIAGDTLHDRLRVFVSERLLKL